MSAEDSRNKFAWIILSRKITFSSYSNSIVDYLIFIISLMMKIITTK